MNERVVISHGPADTHRLAARLLAHLPGRAVLALHGDLGSGKTCFVQGLAAALGIERPVTSPTFTLIHEYRGTRALVHVDLYRIRDSDDAIMLGLDEYFDTNAVTAVEWADRAADLFPPQTVHLYFEVAPGMHQRRITIRLPDGIDLG